MTLEEATDAVGSGYVTVAAREQGGSQIHAIKYKGGDGNDLFLYFKDDRLIQWGDTDVLNAIPGGVEGGGAPAE